MRSRFFTLVAIAAVAFNSAAFSVFGQSARPYAEAELVKLLPASDLVAVVNVKRLLNDALPTLFAAKPEYVVKIKEKLDEFQGKAGFDVRSIDTAVVGLNVKPTEGGKYEMEPVAIAKGSFNGGAIIALLRTATDKDNDVRVEQIGTHTMVVIKMEDEAKEAGDKAADAAAKVGDMAKDAVEKIEDPFADEMAIAAMPNGGIAIGSVARVRQTLLANTKLDPAIAPILAKYPGSVAKFASITPVGMQEYVPVDNDFIGTTLKGIRTLGGGFDVTPEVSTFMLGASTELPDQAKGIFDLLDGLMTLGKNIFGASSRDDQKTYLRLLEAVKLTNEGNNVDLTLPVPQSDIDALVRTIKDKKADEPKPDGDNSADAAKPATPADGQK